MLPAHWSASDPAHDLHIRLHTSSAESPADRPSHSILTNQYIIWDNIRQQIQRSRRRCLAVNNSSEAQRQRLQLWEMIQLICVRRRESPRSIAIRRHSILYCGNRLQYLCGARVIKILRPQRNSQLNRRQVSAVCKASSNRSATSPDLRLFQKTPRQCETRSPQSIYLTNLSSRVTNCSDTNALLRLRLSSSNHTIKEIEDAIQRG